MWFSANGRREGERGGRVIGNWRVELHLDPEKTQAASDPSPGLAPAPVRSTRLRHRVLVRFRPEPYACAEASLRCLEKYQGEIPSHSEHRLGPASSRKQKPGSPTDSSHA